MEDYRSCAAALVIRPAAVCTSSGHEECFEILLVHKPRKRDDWQIPQGGIEEGESAAEAAVREANEEAGIDIEVLEDTGIVYQYDYPARYKRARPDHLKGQRVQFVIAQLTPGSRVQVDRDEIDGHVWVLPEMLSQYLEREAYLRVVEKVVERVGNAVNSCRF